MCLAETPSRTKKKKIKIASERINHQIQESKSKSSLLTHRRLDQQTIYEGFGLRVPEPGELGITSIVASGDELVDKEEGVLRIALQNPNGIRLSENVDVMPEVAAMERLQINIAAFPESKLASYSRTTEVLQRQLNVRIGSAYVRNAAAQRRNTRTTDYQPGGVLTAITGRVTGRILKSGIDPWGRFTWTTFRGNRDEGIIFIAAYRVCQKKGTKAGTNTAFMQQIEEMIDEELRESEEYAKANKPLPTTVRRSLDPRDRLLQDLKQIIVEYRNKGFRPILCMDANEDWTNARTGKALRNFLQETQLQDPLHQRFHKDGLTASTYARGSSRIDYMFFDEALLPSIRRIGTLGLHDAMVSDHVMLYADMDEKELFQGLINRPVRIPSREFIIAQADKCEKFLEEVKILTKDIPFQVNQLVETFRRFGATEYAIKEYNKLDKIIHESILAAAKKTVHKKIGYKRSPELGEAGMKVNFWKSIKSSIYRRSQPPVATVKMAEKLQIEIDEAMKMNKNAVLKQVDKMVQELRKIQRNASQHRQEWLERNAQNVAKAAKIDDWRKHMEKMLRDEKE